MQKVAIFGVGLMGGSFALALRRAGFQGEILGVSSSSTVSEAIHLGVIDRGVPLEEAAAIADLVYLAQPICQIIETIKLLAGRLKPGAIVTDAGSTKVEIVEQGTRLLGPDRFLGGHPMAGKELRGVRAAEAGLFHGRTYFFCAPNQSIFEHPFAKELIAYVEKFGASPVMLAAEEHDRLVSLTSHLPQLASTSLACVLSKSLSSQLARSGAGPGLVDMTRLAKSSYDLWADILSTNAVCIDRALSLYIEELQSIRESLNRQSIGTTFDQGAQFAAFVRKPR